LKKPHKISLETLAAFSRKSSKRFALIGLYFYQRKALNKLLSPLNAANATYYDARVVLHTVYIVAVILTNIKELTKLSILSIIIGYSGIELTSKSTPRVIQYK